MLSQNEQISVLRIICAQLSGATIPFPMNGTDYNSVFKAGSEHGFYMLLYKGLKEIYLPDGTEQQYNTKKADFAEKQANLKRLQDILESENRNYMLIDGAALMGLYEDKYLRCGKDFNILVEEANRESIRYSLEKNGFKHVRECFGCDFFMLGKARFCIMSQDFAYDGAFSIWSKALKTQTSRHRLSQSDRYICALLKLKQRLDKGFGGVMQLIDIFMLKIASGDGFNSDYISQITTALGLNQIVEKTNNAYDCLFSDEKSASLDTEFIDKIFREVPLKLPEKYITPERKKFFKKLKIITAISAISAIVIAAVVIALIIVNSNATGSTSSEEESAVSQASSAPADECETPFGYYKGQLNDDGVPHGVGTLTFYNGDLYEGEFVNGKRTGVGKITFKSGGSFEGDFKDDVICGNGQMIYTNGDTVTGQFANDLPNGECTVKYSDGTTYTGSMVDGVRQGQGKFVYLNKDVYEGEFIDGFRSGYGVYKYVGGAVYKGNWVEGVQSGEGVFTDAHGTYTGNFTDGEFSGKGTYQYANGDLYVGDWKSGKQHGQGKLTSGQSSYEGGFADGLFNGYGVKTFKEGDIVKGVFVNGLLNGEADYYFKKYGYWRKALYKDGELVKYLDEN